MICECACHEPSPKHDLHVSTATGMILYCCSTPYAQPAPSVKPMPLTEVINFELKMMEIPRTALFGEQSEGGKWFDHVLSESDAERLIAGWCLCRHSPERHRISADGCVRCEIESCAIECIMPPPVELVEEARRMGIPVFETVEDLKAWLS